MKKRKKSYYCESKSYQNTHLFFILSCFAFHVWGRRCWGQWGGALFTRICEWSKLITQISHYYNFSARFFVDSHHCRDFPCHSFTCVRILPLDLTSREVKPDPSISVTWSQPNISANIPKIASYFTRFSRFLFSTGALFYFFSATAVFCFANLLYFFYYNTTIKIIFLFS